MDGYIVNLVIYIDTVKELLDHLETGGFVLEPKITWLVFMRYRMSLWMAVHLLSFIQILKSYEEYNLLLTISSEA